MEDLLNTLQLSGLGARIGEVFCGAPMYADDLALVASSPEELQAMLDIVSRYASQWRYQLNSSKSVILVLGESPRSRALARSNRQWLLAGQQLQEVDEHHHLGILHSVHHALHLGSHFRAVCRWPECLLCPECSRLQIWLLTPCHLL